MLCVIHATVCYNLLGAFSDHGGLGDGYMRIFSHLLAEFLLPNVNCESPSGVNWFVECVEVDVNLGLRDFCVFAHAVVIDVVDGDPVEALVRVPECGEHLFVERGGPNIDGDATCVDILGPVDVQYLVLSSEAFAPGRIFTGNYVEVRWGCIGGWVVEVPISSV